MKRTIILILPALAVAMTVWAQMAPQTNAAGETKMVSTANPDSAAEAVVIEESRLESLDLRMFSRKRIDPLPQLQAIEAQSQPVAKKKKKKKQLAQKSKAQAQLEQ